MREGYKIQDSQDREGYKIQDSQDRCCDCGNFPRTHLSGSRLSWLKLAKAKSRLVPTFHR